MIKSDKKNERDESKVFVYVSIIHIYIMPICRISHLFRFKYQDVFKLHTRGAFRVLSVS